MQTQMETRNPWSFLGDLAPHAVVVYDELHTAMTEAEYNEKLQAAQFEARKLVQEGVTFKVYRGIRNYVNLTTKIPAEVEMSFSAPTAELKVRAFPNLVIDGISCNYWVDVKSTYSRSFGYRSTPTGKCLVTVGSYKDKVNYPQKKDGSFSYDKMANQLLHLVKTEKSQRSAENRRESNKLVAKMFRDELGIPEWGYGGFEASPSTDAEKPIRVEIKIDRALTVENATKLYRLLKEAGYVK